MRAHNNLDGIFIQCNEHFWSQGLRLEGYVQVRKYYKNHLKALTSRVNVFTGVAYKNDPTIFSWNLYNEPRNPDNQTGPGSYSSSQCEHFLRPEHLTPLTR